MMDGKKVIAKILKAESVDFVTCFPYNPVIDAIAAEGIRPVMPRTERVAVGIADGFTRASFGRRNGVCLVQTGPGSENQFAGVAQAFADSVPILLLPCGYDRRELRRPQFVALNNYRAVTKCGRHGLLCRPDTNPDASCLRFAPSGPARPGNDRDSLGCCFGAIR